MILYHQDLLLNVEAINQLLGSSTPYAQVQKITSTSHFVLLDVRLKGRSITILIGRGDGFEGIFVGGKAPAQWRVRDPFLEYLRAHLRGGHLQKISTHKTDRIVFISFVKEHEAHLGLFWKGKKLYVAHIYRLENGWELMRSWAMKDKQEFTEVTDPTELLTKSFEQLSIRTETQAQNGRVVSGDEVIANYKKEILQKVAAVKSPRKERRFLKRKKEKISEDLLAIDNFLSIEEMLIKDCLDLGTGNEIIIGGEKIRVSKEWGHHKRRELLFDRIKRLKYSRKIVETRLLETLKMLECSKEEKVTLDLPKTILPVWESGIKKVIHSFDDKSKSYEEYAWNKIHLAVGKSAKANDQLRRDFSKKGAWWFHAEGVAGAHVVLSGITNPVSDQKLIDLVGSMIRDYSGITSLEISMMYAALDDVKSMKGSAGSVILKKPKFIRAIYDPKWREILAIS